MKPNGGKMGDKTNEILVALDLSAAINQLCIIFKANIDTFR